MSDGYVETIIHLVQKSVCQIDVKTAGHELEELLEYLCVCVRARARARVYERERETVVRWRKVTTWVHHYAL
jgi:hypothetical protein